MPYSAIPAAWILAGEPTKEELFALIKANQESFNTDIENLKQTSKIDIFDIKFHGYIEQYTTAQITERAPTFKSPVGLTITSFVITLLEASTSGTLSVDIQKSTDNGINWNTLLTSSVQLTGTTVGSISDAVNWIDISSQNIAQNNLIRIVVDGVQVGQGAFHVSIYGEVA